MREGASGVIALGVFQSLAQCLAGLGKAARETGKLINSDGSILDLNDVLDLTRLPEDVFSPSIDLLCEVGWITLIKPTISQRSPNDLPSPPNDLPKSPNGEDRIGEDRRGEEGLLSDESDVCAPWVKFWEAYPESGRKRSSREKVKKSWTAVKPPSDTMLTLEMWKTDPEWQKEGGRFVPAADRWLREKKWQDPPSIKNTKSPRRAGGSERTPADYETPTDKKQDEDHF